MATQTLDATGLNCPLPILRTKKALGKMQVGETLAVISTDTGSIKDMAAFCKQTGNIMVETAEVDMKYTFLIEKT